MYLLLLALFCGEVCLPAVPRTPYTPRARVARQMWGSTRDQFSITLYSEEAMLLIRISPAVLFNACWITWHGATLANAASAEAPVRGLAGVVIFLVGVAMWHFIGAGAMVLTRLLAWSVRDAQPDRMEKQEAGEKAARLHGISIGDARLGYHPTCWHMLREMCVVRSRLVITSDTSSSQSGSQRQENSAAYLNRALGNVSGRPAVAGMIGQSEAESEEQAEEQAEEEEEGAEAEEEITSTYTATLTAPGRSWAVTSVTFSFMSLPMYAAIVGSSGFDVGKSVPGLCVSSIAVCGIVFSVWSLGYTFISNGGKFMREARLA